MPRLFQAVADPAIEQNFRALERLLPLQGQNIANGAVGADQLATSAKALFIQGGESGLWAVRGGLTTGGVIAFGEDFTAKKTGTGQVELAFSPAFTATPAVTANAFYNAGPYDVDIVEATKEKAVLYVLNSTTGVATEGTLHFLAIGPR